MPSDREMLAGWIEEERQQLIDFPLGQDSGFPRAGPGGRVTPRFRHRLIRFRHFNSGSLALASLNLTRRESLSQRWLQRSPPSLLATAACSGLRPAPDCRPRRALLHLSYSSAPPYSDGAFVTHDPRRKLQDTNSSSTCGGTARPEGDTLGTRSENNTPFRDIGMAAWAVVV